MSCAKFISTFEISLDQKAHGFVAEYAVHNRMMMSEAVKLLFLKGLAMEAERMDEVDIMEGMSNV